ncbi:MAG: 2-oxoacid:acceptor oxidoreductase subunit alpha [Bdellovibrionales bacterium]|nr:2-oxoacid:acceptor oxidoreductase subunit alpha [Bdellovibrionales bacterium]
MSNLSFNISTVNGTGSLSANQLLTRILFRSGWNLGAYNFFPSNIAGLACLYHIRINSQAHIGFSSPSDILISLNPKTFSDDMKELKPEGLLISDEKNKISPSSLKDFKGLHWKIPITDSTKPLNPLSLKQRALFKNMVYLAFLCYCLKVDLKLIKKSLLDFFQKPEESDIIQKNLKIFDIVSQWSSSYSFPFPIPSKKQRNQEQSKKKEILIDGNSSSALGALFAGCQFLSWYPITPASSLAENFEHLVSQYQKDSEGKNKVLVLQSEDELAAISQVIGAGWAGLRAMTTSSGPGLSLMAEATGLSYFAEIPAVIGLVQRAGPSTGLPTRTQQSDLLSACFLSHGDSKHIVLIPGNPKECFDFTKLAFDLAEQLQTLVIVLSDLDLGLNLRISSKFQFSKSPLKKQTVLREKDLDTRDFIPYQDENKKGLSYRTLPGIQNPKGVHFTRGSGHNKNADYSERPEDYEYILNKLGRKWETAKKEMPSSYIEFQDKAKLAFITFGANEASVKELRDDLLKKNIPSNYLRVRSFPFKTKEIFEFLKKQEIVFVAEQNRDAQLKQLLSGEFPEDSFKLKSLLQYDGRPLMFSKLKLEFEKQAPFFLKNKLQNKL